MPVQSQSGTLISEKLGIRTYNERSFPCVPFLRRLGYTVKWENHFLRKRKKEQPGMDTLYKNVYAFHGTCDAL